MSDANSTHHSEIDLIEIMQTVWNGKWKIIFCVISALLLIYIYQKINPNKTFISKTSIKPISLVEQNKYQLFNGLINYIRKNEIINNKENKQTVINISDNEVSEFKSNKINNPSYFFQITPEKLLSLFLEELESGEILEDAIKRFNLLNKDNFKSEKNYNDAVIKLASKLKILSPYIKPEVMATKFSKNNFLEFQYNNVEKWEKALEYTIKRTNMAVKNVIINSFKNSVKEAKQTRKFELEDINTKINNELSYYNDKEKNRLAYLKEQSSIARKLKIKNYISPDKNDVFIYQTKELTKFKNSTPLYFRGYIALEEEINLIKSRSSKERFIPEILDLQRKKISLQTDKSIERSEELFLKTPLAFDNFEAVVVKVASTTYEFNDKSGLYYIFSLIFGLIFGVLYVLINNAIYKNQKI